MNKKTLTPIVLAGIFFLMLGLSFAAVPLYDLFFRVTGFGGTTQNAENKEINTLARRIFLYSIFYLFIIFLLILSDHFFMRLYG